MYKCFIKSKDGTLLYYINFNKEKIYDIKVVIQIADKILVVISKMDSFIGELRKGIDKTEAVKKDIQEQRRILINGFCSDAGKEVQENVGNLLKVSRNILDTMGRMSVKLNTAKTEFIKADQNSFKTKSFQPKRIYRGEKPSKEAADKAHIIPNNKLEIELGKYIICYLIKEKLESDKLKKELEVGDFDSICRDFDGMDLENTLNAITLGEAGAAIEGFESLVNGASKGLKLLKIGIEGAKKALSKLTVEDVALAFAGAKGLIRIEETVKNLDKEEGIIKAALEAAKQKLDNLSKIVTDMNSVEKNKSLHGENLVKEVSKTETYTDAMKKYIIVPEDGFQALLERKYIEIRKSGLSDVKTVSKNTGLSEQDIVDMKKHLFLNTHDLSIGGSAPKKLYFQADPDIAYAWQKAQSGELTELQKKWFKTLRNHEITEKKSMDNGMLLRHPSTWNAETEQFTSNPLKNAHDKANLTSPNPTDPFPGYDAASDFIKNIDKDINY